MTAQQLAIAAVELFGAAAALAYVAATVTRVAPRILRLWGLR